MYCISSSLTCTVRVCSHMIILCVHAGSVILGNVTKLPDLPESLKIPGSQLKLGSDPIGQGENISYGYTCSVYIPKCTRIHVCNRSRYSMNFSCYFYYDDPLCRITAM